MAQLSAGILLHRSRGGAVEVFLVHPGGPFWARKDEAAWSIPKGLIDAEEDPLAAARREFAEETGFVLQDDGAYRDLGVFRLTGGKNLHVFARRGDCDAAALRSNSFEMMWPPKSGRLQSFPEVDRGGWFAEPQALVKITKGQRPVLQAFFAQPPDDGQRRRFHLCP